MSAPPFSYSELVTRNIGFVSEAEQEKLRQAHVFVAGVGGMGGAALACLVRSGVGRFTIADVDVFEVSNLNRQIFADLDSVGHPKVDATKRAIARINPECKVRTLGAEWVRMLDELLPDASVAINGCDDVRATLALMRAGEVQQRTVIDAFAATLPNVYVVRPQDPRPEKVFSYPSLGVPLGALTDAIVAGCVRKEAEWVLTHSSTADFVQMDIAAQVVAGTRKRISFAPMVWTTGCLMAYEAIREILARPGAPGPKGIFYNPWTGRAERPRNPVVAAIRGLFVRRFLGNISGEPK